MAEHHRTFFFFLIEIYTFSTSQWEYRQILYGQPFFSCQGARVRWGITSNRITDEVQLARVDATFPTFPALILPLSFAVVAFILSLSFKTREKKDVMCGRNGQYGFSSMFKGRSLEGYGKTQNSGLFFSFAFLLFLFGSFSFFFGLGKLFWYEHQS